MLDSSPASQPVQLIELCCFQVPSDFCVRALEHVWDSRPAGILLKTDIEYCHMPVWNFHSFHFTLLLFLFFFIFFFFFFFFFARSSNL